DLAVTLGFISSDTVQILLGNGDGTFTLGASYAIGPVSQSIVAADLRKNGKTDLAVAALEGGAIAVLLGNGDGTFEQPVLYGILDPMAVAVGDMNGDGISDLVAIRADASNGLVYIFPGSGYGTFRSPEIFYPVGQFPRDLALADFNGDHQLDVTVADQSGYKEYVLLNTGHVSFSPITPMHFGKQKVGTTSPPQKVVMTNQGKTLLAIHSMKATGQFSVTSTCGTSLAAKASCTISVTFSPTTAGLKSGTVQINDSASAKPQVVALSGTGD
ncbi:MAG TPA: FG-GAP-like repeat-containing protein, partial [Candidatus Sulfotelmatobacter sp.]|nr:FG-GAP-like repeat-containing protein [Candidatus Sulfotelmatobacter sp.]